MSEKETSSVFIADKFAVAEVALYISAVLQVVTALMMAAGVVPLGLAQQATTMQRVTVTTNAVSTFSVSPSDTSFLRGV